MDLVDLIGVLSLILGLYAGLLPAVGDGQIGIRFGQLQTAWILMAFAFGMASVFDAPASSWNVALMVVPGALILVLNLRAWERRMGWLR